MSDPLQRAGAILTIDLGAVVANWQQLRDRVAPGECAGVVKADAYGLGVAQVVPALVAAGCKTFAVAQFEEALAVRALAKEARILCLGGLPSGTETEMAEHRILPVLNHLGEVAAWRSFAGRQGRAMPAVIQIDTGMNRAGLGPDELDALVGMPEWLNGIDVRYWMTHLACADDIRSDMSRRQLADFTAALKRLPRAPASFANSAGIFHGPDFHFDLCRPGCALYGVNPTPHLANPMQGTIRLDARVLQVRNVDSPMTVGYGASHRVERKGKVATIAVGYADGYLRSLSGRGHVYVNGVPAPVVGRVSMDLVTVDVTDLPEGAVQAGGLVELIGPNRPVDTVAAEAGTIGYEILTSLGPRYHRVYLDPPATI